MQQDEEEKNFSKLLWANAASVNKELQRSPIELRPTQYWDNPESDFTSDGMVGQPVPRKGLSGKFAHADLHEYVQGYCQEVVSRWRYRVEPMWSIEVRVRCPEQMGGHEASVWWDQECWYACVEVMCTHLEEMLEWLVVHEVAGGELRRWRSTTHIFEVLGLLVDGADKDRLVRQFHVARNQEIEMETYELLGHHRPFHMREGE